MIKSISLSLILIFVFGSSVYPRSAEIEKIRSPGIEELSAHRQSLSLFEKANLYLSAKRYREAVGYYRQVLGLDSYFTSAYYNLALAYFFWGRYTQSIQNFIKVTELEPSEGRAYFYLGWIYKRLENYRQAEKYLKTARKLFSSQGNDFLVRQTDGLLAGLKILPDK